MPPLAEQELILSIATGDPKTVGVIASWPRWQRRLQACAGFSGRHGAVVSEGEFPLKHLWLRRHLGASGQAEFARRRAELPPLLESVSDYRPDAGERETRFLAVRDQGYWLEVESDAAVWVTRLLRHPFFVPLQRVEYANGDCWISGVVPLSLLTVRKTLPQGRPLSEDEKQVLRERLAAARRR